MIGIRIEASKDGLAWHVQVYVIRVCAIRPVLAVQEHVHGPLHMA